MLSSFCVFNFAFETRSHIAEVGLELLVLLPPPPKCWDSRCVLPCLAALYHSLLKIIINKNKKAAILIYCPLSYLIGKGYFVPNEILVYVHGCFACMYVYAPYACSALGSQKRASDPLNWS